MKQRNLFDSPEPDPRSPPLVDTEHHPMPNFVTERKRLGGHGILSDDDIAELKAGTRRVYDLMCDGEWHNANDIRMAAGKDGVPASEGTRRLRELRTITGLCIERRKVDGVSRLFEYRIEKRST